MGIRKKFLKLNLIGTLELNETDFENNEYKISDIGEENKIRDAGRGDPLIFAKKTITRPVQYQTQTVPYQNQKFLRL